MKRKIKINKIDSKTIIESIKLKFDSMKREKN